MIEIDNCYNMDCLDGMRQMQAQGIIADLRVIGSNGITSDLRSTEVISIKAVSGLQKYRRRCRFSICYKALRRIYDKQRLER